MIGDLLADAIGDLLGEAAGDALSRRRRSRPTRRTLRGRRIVWCALRVTSGSCEGLTSGWTSGRAVVGSRSLVFRPTGSRARHALAVGELDES